MTNPTSDPSAEAQPKLTPQQEAQQRAHECGQRIQQLCADYRCRIVPFLRAPEPVGVDGSRMLIQASYGVIPDDL
jgi:hypothetical protein